jgi:hypothetical protein
MTARDVDAIEAIRARYRPERITTLFVGESAPFSGRFFYYGNSAMSRYMQRAMALDASSDFLEAFKACGWYLDDLVLEPVNRLTKAERKAKWLGAQDSLAQRIAEYQPLAIVTLLRAIKDIVEAAAIAARCDAPRYAVPFPGNGLQGRFLSEMAHIIPRLPRLPI